MPKKPGRKLKVFQARIGFYDIVVTTGSKAAALRAWGTRQDLFAQGVAEIVTDPAIISAATEHPDTPLRRPVGSDLPFSTEVARPRLADIDPNPGDVEAEAEEGARPATRPKPAPDRRELDAAEDRMAELDREHAGEESEFNRRLADIEAEEAALQARRATLEEGFESQMQEWRRLRTDAELTVEQERRAYRRAGGKD